MDGPILEILVTTHGADGLRRVGEMRLPEVPGVRYLVSCQSKPVPIPESLGSRAADIDPRFIDGTGLSANRNALLDRATAPLVMFADNDLTLKAEWIEAMIKTMDENPGLDGACFQPQDKLRPYPAEPYMLKAHASPYHYAPIYELVFRREALMATGVRFSLRVGINAPYLHSGEDDLFLYKILCKGLRVKYFPIATYNHPHLSTGFRHQRPGVLRSRGAVLQTMYPLTAVPRMFRLACKLPQRTLPAFGHMLEGAVYAVTHRL